MSYGEYDSQARRPERLSAEQVAAWDFPHAGLTRRGLDEEVVQRFRRRVLTELRTAGEVEAELRARNDDLTAQLRATYRSNSPSQGVATAGKDSAAAPGSGARNEAAQEQRVTAAAVNAISMAQQQAEEQIRAAEEYVRNVTEYARNQYQATVNEGHRQGLIAAETAWQRRSEELSSSLTQLESQLDFLKAFGVAFGVQVEGALEKARDEVHTMIGTIRTAFDTLKGQQPVQAGQQQGIPGQRAAGLAPGAGAPLPG